MRRLNSLAIAVSVAVTTPLLGCSKKEGGDTTAPKALTNQLISDPLLKKLPQSTAGFLILDFAGAGYQSFKVSPWGKEAHGLSAIKAGLDEMKGHGASDEQTKLAQTALDTAQKLGLVTADGQSQVDKVISRNVTLVEAYKNKEIPFNVATFAEAAPGVDLTERVPVLKTVVVDGGLKVTDKTFGTGKGFSATIEDQSDPEAPSLTLNVAATKNLLGISLNAATLEQIFSENTTPTIDEIQALPEFKKAEESVRSSGDPLSFAFVSLKRLAPFLEALQDEGDGAVKDSPLSAIALAQGFSGQMVTLAALTVAPTTEQEKTVVTAFENSALPATAFKVPTDTAFSLALDARILAKLESALGGTSDPSTAMVLQQLKNVQGLTLGLRASDGSTPLPELFLAVESNARDSVATSVESAIGMGMLASGQPLKWQNKEIDGSPTKYFTTPLGIGAYVSSPKGSNTLLVATSERVVHDTLVSSSGKGTSLDGAMPRALRERMVPSTVGALYLNFIQLGNVVDSVKGTLAMMMGASQELDDALNSEKLKKLGIGFGSLSYSDGVFRVQSTFDRNDTVK
jgi:hypothetical protein